MAAMIAVAPFSIPASADDTRCSANGNMLSGNASQMHAEGGGRPAVAPAPADAAPPAATDRVRKPIDRRMKVTPGGAIASSPSAMNRNEAPQMTPGTTSSARIVEVRCATCRSR